MSNIHCPNCGDRMTEGDRYHSDMPDIDMSMQQVIDRWMGGLVALTCTSGMCNCTIIVSSDDDLLTDGK